MGIDVYLKWDNQTEAENQAQYTGFSTVAGSVGYLREAYHGSPYATHALFPRPYWEITEEESEAGGKLADIAELKDRLAQAVLVATFRNHVLYEQGTDPSYAEIGDIAGKLAKVFADMDNGRGQTDDVIARITPEQVAQVEVLIEARKLPGYALAFVDFVRLAEKLAAEGRNPRVYISY
ncbi:MAG: hypothetical protein E6Q97_34310 [Desulfurellales bacterium]|nr:MAG: hypothetical protein E6Q97_34310 [Desulfurellales bacterium]